MSFKDIGAQIKSVLDIVKNAPNSGLAEVYDYEIPDGNAYPFATISTGQFDEDVEDTKTNLAKYNFIVRVVDVNKDKATMELNMRAVADDIMAEMRKAAHDTFGGLVVRVLPFKIEWKWDTQDQLPMRYFELNIEVWREFSI